MFFILSITVQLEISVTVKVNSFIKVLVLLRTNIIVSINLFRGKHMNHKDYMDYVERHASSHYMHNLPHNSLTPPDWADDSFWQGLLEGLVNWFS
jgi:hypothetical protein